MGMNRSATMLAAYLCVARRWPVARAVHAVTAVQPYAIANRTFQAELLALAQANGLCARSPRVDARVAEAAAAEEAGEVEDPFERDLRAARRARLAAAARQLGLNDAPEGLLDAE